MALQSVFHGITAPRLKFFSHQILSRGDLGLRDQRTKTGIRSNFLVPCFNCGFSGFSLRSLNRGRTVCASRSNSDVDTKLKHSGREGSGPPIIDNFDAPEPFRGKAGSVSFYGSTHQSVEEGKLVSSPFTDDHGSYIWLLGPLALVASLLLPQFFLGPLIGALLKDQVRVEIVSSLYSEVLFYFGLSTFLTVTNEIQRPYLQFSPRRWSLLTGLKGYLTSSFFTMGFKVIVPLFLLWVSWPVLGLPALVAVLPFLVSCIAQRAFEIHLEKHGSSCWPLIPIIFEVYRIYQLTKATHFVEKLMLSMKQQLPQSAQLEVGNTLVGMVVTFQVLGMVCLWSFVTFLMRLFPSRPVAENY